MADENTKEIINLDDVEYKPTGIFPTAHEWKMMTFMADAFFKGGAMPKGIDSIAKLIVIIQAGSEIGLKPIQALGSIAVIGGRTMCYGTMPFALTERAGHKIVWNETSEQVADVTVIRGDTKKEYNYRLTYEDAQTRGMTEKGIGTWRTHKARMLRYAAFREIASYALADVFNGMTVGEDADVTNIILEEEGKKKVFKKKAVSTPKEKKTGPKVVSAPGVIPVNEHGE